jgi:hypothetical protein
MNLATTLKKLHDSWVEQADGCFAQDKDSAVGLTLFLCAKRLSLSLLKHGIDIEGREGLKDRLETPKNSTKTA